MNKTLCRRSGMPRDWIVSLPMAWNLKFTAGLVALAGIAALPSQAQVVAAWDFNAVSNTSTEGWASFRLGASHSSTAGGLTLTQAPTGGFVATSGKSPVAIQTNAPAALLEAGANEMTDGFDIGTPASQSFTLSGLSAGQTYQLQFVGVVKLIADFQNRNLTLSLDETGTSPVNLLDCTTLRAGENAGYSEPVTFTADASQDVIVTFAKVNAGGKCVSGLIVNEMESEQPPVHPVVPHDSTVENGTNQVMTWASQEGQRFDIVKSPDLWNWTLVKNDFPAATAATQTTCSIAWEENQTYQVWSVSNNLPNLLFIMTDQQRWDTMSLAGNSGLPTPNLDRIGLEGAFFENFYATRAICIPSRAALLTGCSPQTTGIYGNGDYTSEPQTVVMQTTFDRILHSRGYYTRYSGKWHTSDNLLYHEDGVTPVYDNPDIGNHDHNVELVRMQEGQKWGYGNSFRAFLDGNCPYGLNTNPVPRSIVEDPTHHLYVSSRYQGLYEALPSDKNRLSGSGEFGRILVDPEYSFLAYQAKQGLMALNDAALLDQPFAITVSFGPPHPPMIVPDPWFSMFPADDMTVPASLNESGIGQPYKPGGAPYNNPAVVKDMKQCYYAMVKEADHWVGQILDRVDELGLAENTLIVFTSDHGEMLGDHGMDGKSIVYEGGARVPGMLRFPAAIPAGTVVKTPAASIDLFPTILDYLNVPYPDVDGYSVRPLIEGNASEGDHPDYCVAEERLIGSTGSRADNRPMYAVRTERWKLIMGEDQTSTATDALYDINADPGEMTNLIATAEGQIAYRDVSETMKMRLVDYLNRIGSTADAASIAAREVAATAPIVDGALNWNAVTNAATPELSLIEVACDGNTVAANIGGRNCRAKANAASDLGFYFNIDASLIHEATKGTDVAIECDYYVSGNPTEIVLSYDGAKGPTEHALIIEEGTVGQWKTMRWYIKDAYFGDRMTNGTDFQIRVPAGTAGYLSRVKVVTPESADWPPFELKDGAVKWSDSTDALGWKLHVAPTLRASNEWNIVSYDVLSSNGTQLYHVSKTSQNEFFKMMK